MPADSLPVAAYCRVSTDGPDQSQSLQSQTGFFRAYIQDHPHWHLTRIYADRGVTGTSLGCREAFQAMLRDAQEGRFSLLLTKEVSRFSRNILDAVACTRQLGALGIGVIFLTDGIDTRDPDAELRLTILASLAQEESRRTSGRVKWGQQRRMEQGVVFGGPEVYGYFVKNGKLILRPEQAEVVREIFERCALTGQGTHVIARELTVRGIPTPQGGTRWSPATVLRILRNEKYAGDLRQKKFCTPDYLTHKKIENRGREPQVFLVDHHTPIVPRALFDQAQEALDRRRTLPNGPRYSQRHWCSGRLICKACGRALIPKTTRRKTGTVYRIWVCPGCPGTGGPRSINETALAACLEFALGQLALDEQAAARDLIARLTALPGTDRQARQTRLKARLQRAREAYLEGVIDLETLRRADTAWQEACRKQESAEAAACLPAPAELTELLQGPAGRERLYKALVRSVLVAPPALVLSFHGCRTALEVEYCAVGRGRGYRVGVLRGSWLASPPEA